MTGPVLTYALLGLAAFVAGAVNSLAGGGTLLTFPVLLSVQPPVLANATSTVALMPGSAAGAWGYRRELRGTRAWLLLLGPPSLAGGLVGALLLISLPEDYFDALIPWLLLTASLLFVFQPALGRFVLSHPEVGLPRPGVCLAVVGFQFLVAVYGGYFGAGIGILMLTSLAFMGLGDIHRMNAVKTFLAACINGVSILVFVAGDRVAWHYGLSMALAGILGGFCGAHFGRRLPQAAVRWFVIAVGLALSAYYFARQAGALPSASGRPTPVHVVAGGPRSENAPVWPVPHP
jgi:uncharacterized membrane protein YfcA